MSGSVNPLSIGSYDQIAGNTGAGAVAQGASGLANALIGNPAAIAQAKYLGSETGRAKAETQQLDQTATNRAFVRDALATPGALADGPTLQKVGAIVAGDPSLAQYFGQTISVMRQNQAQTGGQSQQSADTFSAGTGTAAYGNTKTGDEAGLANATGIANIQAGANMYGSDKQLEGTLGSANIQSQTSERNTDATLATDRALPGITSNSHMSLYYGADGRPVMVSDGQAAAEGLTPVPGTTEAAKAAVLGASTQPPSPNAGAPVTAAPEGTAPPVGSPTPVNSPLAASLAGFGTSGPQGPNSAAGLGGVPPPGAATNPYLFGQSVPGDGTTPGAAPDAPAAVSPPPQPGQSAALAGTLGGAPAPAPAPSPSAPAPVAAATPQGSANGLSPDQLGQVRGNVIAGETGMPLQGPMAPQQAAQMDQLITTRLTAGHPVSVGGNAPNQQLLNPIRLQAAWLLAHDPTMRGNTENAVTQAIANVTGGDGKNVDQDLHVMPSFLGGKPGPSMLELKDPSKITWPPGMPVPPQYAAGQPAAAGAPAAPPGAAPPSNLSGALTGQSAPPAPPPARPGLAATIAPPTAIPAPAAPPQAQQVYSAPKTAPVQQPPRPAGMDNATLINQASQMLARGADRGAILARLRAWGIDTSSMGG